MVIADGASAYLSLQNEVGCKVVNAKKQEDKFYHLNNVNSLHSFFKTRYSVKRRIVGGEKSELISANIPIRLRMPSRNSGLW